MPSLDACAFKKPLGGTTNLHFQPNLPYNLSSNYHINRLARTEEELERHIPYKKAVAPGLARGARHRG